MRFFFFYIVSRSGSYRIRLVHAPSFAVAVRGFKVAGIPFLNMHVKPYVAWERHPSHATASMCYNCSCSDDDQRAHNVKTVERCYRRTGAETCDEINRAVDSGGREGKWVHPHVNIISCLVLRSADVPQWAGKLPQQLSGRHCSFVFRRLWKVKQSHYRPRVAQRVPRS